MPNFDNIAGLWYMYKYPWRPGLDFIDILKSKSFSNNILILGSTKEFRKLYNGKEIDICDLSKNMINENDIGNKKENILLKNWFDIKGGNYDLILGDLVTLMFNYSNKDKLINNLLGNLSLEGKLILRIVVKKNVPDQKFMINFLNSFKQLNYKNNIYILFNYLSFELVNGFGFKGKEVFKFINKISPLLGVKYKKIFLELTPYNSGSNFCLTEYEFNKLIIKYKLKILYSKSMSYVDEYIIQIKS